MLIAASVAACVVAAIAAGAYLAHENNFVYTDDAEVSAPLIVLSAQSRGTLKRVNVREGDPVRPSETVAWVGDETVSAQVEGLVIDAERNVGSLYQPGQPIVTMIQPAELRIVAKIDEDKGLKDVYPGQRAIFRVDAFGSREFEGTVESVSPTKDEGDVVFSISDKRETKQFEVKISYDRTAVPPLSNGMSARVWIVK
jgi:multidrug resistance efflux pump